MKRLTLLFALLIMASLSFAAIDEFYSFSATNGAYSPITGTDAAISSDDAISAAIPLGFSFPYGADSFTEIKISSNGWVGLGTSQSSSNLSNQLASTSYVPVIAALWDDTSMSSGNVETLLQGSAPNRVFVVQYNNLKWNYSGDNQYNFQIRLYESGKIAIHYGSYTGTPNSASASIGINMLPGGTGWFFSVTPGNPATVSSTTENSSLNQIPDPNTIYEFSPTVAAANDLALSSLSGNTSPTAGIQSIYTAFVRNRGSNPQSTYTVKLFRDPAVELASVNGITIAPGTTQSFDLPWTPSAAGPASLYAKVILTGDENSTNDQSAPLAITIMPAGVQVVTIGSGNELGRIPMDLFYYNSLFETMYYPDELGFSSGTISAVQLYTDISSTITNTPAKIWLGSSTAADLSAGWIPSTSLSLVFDGTLNFPSGQNTINIPLSSPYMHTGGNLVMMVQRPMDTDYYSSLDRFQIQTVGSNRARNAYSDSTPYDPALPPADATISGTFPKTTFFFSTQALVNDLAAVGITGNLNPSTGTASTYEVSIRNNGSATQSVYSIKLMQTGNIELASIPGTTIAQNAVQTYSLSWTPTVPGPTSIFARVELATDEAPANNQSAPLNVDVQQAGIVSVTVGAGDQVGLVPINVYYRNSVFETIYLASELNIGGLITGIRFYNNFQTNLPNLDTVVWLGETVHSNLSGGWIPANQLTQVFNGPVNYPSGQNNITIPFSTPFAYGGGNLVMMVQRPYEDDYYSSQDVFLAQTIGTDRSLVTFNDNTTIDPNNPPTTGTTGQFPKTTFFVLVQGMGSLSGTVTASGQPVEGAEVSVENTAMLTTTDAAGNYSFPYIAIGARIVSASKLGYTMVSHAVTITENNNTIQNFSLSLLALVTVSGRVVGSDAPSTGIANAAINVTGYAPYSTTSAADGSFSIPNVYGSNVYSYTVNAPGYQSSTATMTVGISNLNLGDIVLSEMAYPARDVVATENGLNVDLNWLEPTVAQSGWLHYDDGTNNNSFGTAGSLSFTVAVRFPAASLQEYAGGSLRAIKMWPAQGGNYNVRVWSGGDASGPGAMVVDQNVVPVLNSYNTVLLNDPVYITGTSDLWFGFFCDTTGMNPAYAGFDFGPATPGLGNLIHWQGNWTTSIAVNPYLDFNWNIQGFAGMNAPDGEVVLVPLGRKTERSSAPARLSKPLASGEANRALVGYKVWRLLQGQETNETAWTLLTPDPVNALTLSDTGWASVPDATYLWAVKAAYTGGVLSQTAFSNSLNKVTQVGTIAGVVRNAQNQAISGATISNGTVSATSNSTGAYSLNVNAGTHTLTASAPGYVTGTQNGVQVNTGQTVTVNFVLQAVAVPTDYSDGFESYPDFALQFAPWTLVDVDLSTTYGMTGITWPNAYAAQAFMIFNPSATTPAVTDFLPQEGSKMAASFAATTPPNNDWLISPKVMGGGHLSFWARSYVDTYGLERFKVGISTTGTNPNQFTIISGTGHLEAPVDWTNYYYNLSAYNGQEIYIGINCRSNDAFIFGVDNFDVNPSAGDDPTAPVLNTELQGNYPNPFNPETTIRFSVKEAGPVSIGVYNLKGQLVKTLLRENKAAGNHQVVWNGTDNNGRAVSSGVYYYKMNAGSYQASRKMILVK